MRNIDVVLAKDRSVKAIVLAAFPKYRKRTAWINVFSAGGMNINSYWSGGTRDEYAIVRLEDGARMPMPSVGHPYFEVKGRGVPTGQDQYVAIDHVGNVTLKSLPAGFVLVCAGTFCGKPATAKIYVSAEDMPKFLPAAEAPRVPHTCHYPSTDAQAQKRACQACNPDRPAATASHAIEASREDTGRYQSGYRVYRDGSYREDFGSDR